jgi:hypothetical protein
MKIALSIFLIFFNLNLSAKKPDNCLLCHKNTSKIDNFHPYETFGCYSCHGGDKDATTKEKAHKNIILNPARLEHTSLFCGKCHSKIIKRVKNSMMNSMHGVYDVLRYQFKETKNIKITNGIQAIKGTPLRRQSLAESHFRKLCAACHINQDEKIFKNYAPRGGGCVDCHREKLRIDNGELRIDKKFLHPKFTTKISSKNCLKCHNRSNRIGLSYFGKYESESYGTPYKHGDFTHKIEKNRYYYKLKADIHHAKAGLDCIDCHTEVGVMGDGKVHKHMEGAIDISCKDCHKPKFANSSKYALPSMLSVINGNVPIGKKVALTKRKKTPVYNLQKDKKGIKFYRKRDGKSFKLTLMSDKAYHTLSMHKRLDCSACHSSWAPSCYGCHEVYLDKGKQFDWVARKVTKGQWQEFRSFLRWESPSLGIGYNKKIMPFAPGCQVIATIFKDKKVKKFHSMAMAGWDPHTTQKKSRSCEDCHFNPATLGLGRGIFDIKKGKIVFEPFYDSKKSGQPFSYPIDAFVSKDGREFQSTSRKNARSFNQKEIKKIVNAYKCIICHDKYSDKIYKDFNKSKKLFYSGKTKCLK